MKLRISILIAAILAFLFTISCNEEKPVVVENNVPEIQSITASPSSIGVNETTSLTCVATDADGDNLTITWSAVIGTFPNGNIGVSVEWQAPSTFGSYVIAATVSDGQSIDGDTVNVNVQNGGTAPLPPALSAPPNGITDVSLPPTLTWNSSNGTTSYNLQVSESSNFTILVYNEIGLTQTGHEVAGLDNSTTYYWRVSATNSYGTSWSEVWSFTTETGACPGTPTVVYEGKTYNTVLIGSQCWLKENLDVGMMLDSTQNAGDNGVIEKHCYDDDVANCETYGGLYKWDEAMQYTTNEGTQGICPPGWHIPTQAEFQNLMSTVSGDGNALKAVGQGSVGGGGAGTNTSGFTALLAGGRYTAGHFYLRLGVNTYIWSSTASDAIDAISLGLFTNGSGIFLGNNNRGFGDSVRCLKD